MPRTKREYNARGNGPDKVYTTGQVARLCQVAPRTVGKWVDSGALKGYRIPGSLDRRVPRANLLRFLEEHGLPTLPAERDGPTLVLYAGPPGPAADAVSAALPAAAGYYLQHAATPFAAGLAMAGLKPHAIVVDAAGLGSLDSRAIARRAKEVDPGVLLVLVGRAGDALDWGYDASAEVPALLADAIRGPLARRLALALAGAAS